MTRLVNRSFPKRGDSLQLSLFTDDQVLAQRDCAFFFDGFSLRGRQLRARTGSGRVSGETHWTPDLSDLRQDVECVPAVVAELRL